MPLLDSFKVDHTRMNAPAVRVAKTMRTPKGDDITVFDLRFAFQTKKFSHQKGFTLLSILFAGFMRDHLNNDNVEIIDDFPNGLSHRFLHVINRHTNEQQVADAWLASMKDILTVQDQNQIPELNEYQCGTYTEHSLEEAHDIAKKCDCSRCGD